MPSTSGPVAIITGGASGIGDALCSAYAARGATIVCADIDLPGARRAAERIRASGGIADAAEVDVADAKAVGELVRQAVSAHGRIDLMFNNAGVALTGDLLEQDPEVIRRTLEINVRSAVQGSTAVYPLMAEQGSGHIVNIASLAGLIPTPTAAAYAASKHAVVGFSESLRVEARAHGVRVSVVCPGFVATKLVRNSAALLRQTSADLGEQNLLPPISATACARAIVRGVSRNRPIITVPAYAGVVWRVYRYWPGLYRLVAGRIARRIASAR